MAEESVYVTISDSEEDILSDKVQILANNIYTEFENMIRIHGSGVVNGLTPLIVTMLETMDKLYSNRDELLVKLDLVKEDQAQLYTQYEKEKMARKLAENKINTVEHDFEEERQMMEEKIESLENGNKMTEIKLKNCRDLVTRLEEKETELRKECCALQQRHSELLLRWRVIPSDSHKTTKYSGRSSRVDPDHTDDADSEDVEKAGSQINELMDVAEKDDESEINSKLMMEQIEGNEDLLPRDDTIDTMIAHDDNKEDNNSVDSYDGNEEAGTLLVNYEGLDVDYDDMDGYGDIEYDGMNMEKEIKLLIKENQDLIETKTALNIVKDDLITKLDEMTGELYVTKEELKTTNSLKKEYKSRIYELEKKCAALEEILKENKERLNGLESNEMIECSIQLDGSETKTRITKDEVSRILMERNKYKEELMELREIVHYQSNNKKSDDTKQSRFLYKIFNNLISTASITADTFLGTSDKFPTAIEMGNRQKSTEEFPPMIYRHPAPGAAVRVANPLLIPFKDVLCHGAELYDFVPQHDESGDKNPATS